MVKKKFVVRFYKDVNDSEDNFCISRFRMTEKEYEDFLYDRGNKLILNALKKGNNLKQTINTFTGFMSVFLHRRYNKHKVNRTDHEIYISILSALFKLKKINIFKHILVFKIKSKSSNKIQNARQSILE